jgi:NADH-quinone oxidoreductase subunit M
VTGLADLRVLLLVPVLGALIVALAPERWSRALGGAVAGLALLVAVIVAGADAEALALRVAWVPALGLSLSLGLGALGVPGVLVTCLIGQVAAAAPGGSRGSIAGGLVLQAVVLAGLLARDLGLLVACYGLLAPLVAGLVVSGTSAVRMRAGLVVGFYLSLGTALLALAVGALAVAHHDASGGVWSLELEALGGLLLPGRAEAAIAAALGLAGALTLGLWPLHGWLIAGIGAARPGTAILMAGALRWLGVDLLLRVWLVVTPTAAAAQAPAIAWVAVLGAVYGGCWRAQRGRVGGRSGWPGWCRRGCWCWGWSGSTTRGCSGRWGSGSRCVSAGRRGCWRWRSATGACGGWGRWGCCRRRGWSGLLGRRWC